MGVEKEIGADMGYKVIYGCSNDIKDFEEKVNKALKDGWKPKGNLVVVPYGRQDYVMLYSIFQTMIKK